jgi:hypothetical protein
MNVLLYTLAFIGFVAALPLALAWIAWAIWKGEDDD